MPKSLNFFRGSVSFAALTIAGAASAQDTVPPPDVAENPASTAQEGTSQESVIVTGSRIRRDPLSQDAPIVFVDQEDIAKTGLNSINDVLQRLPSAGGGLNSRFNNSGNFGNPPDGGGVGAGAAEIDLRYLGSRRTLVLVDGLRYVNATSASGVPGSIDLNSIPESMIERVEVLQDGAGDLRLRRHRRRRQHHHQEEPGRVRRPGAARRLRRGRRLYAELPAELGQRRGRVDADRRGRQFRQAEPDQLGRPGHLTVPQPLCD